MTQKFPFRFKGNKSKFPNLGHIPLTKNAKSFQWTKEELLHFYNNETAIIDKSEAKRVMRKWKKKSVIRRNFDNFMFRNISSTCLQ